MKLVRSAKVVIIDSSGEALLLIRSNSHPSDALSPDIPGGTIENGETIEAGLIREIKEETGLIIEETALKLIYSFTFDNIPGISINRLLYGLRLEEKSPIIDISWEHDQYSWVAISELVGLEKPYQKGVDYANEHSLWSEI